MGISAPTLPTKNASSNLWFHEIQEILQQIHEDTYLKRDLISSVDTSSMDAKMSSRTHAGDTSIVMTQIRLNQRYVLHKTEDDGVPSIAQVRTVRDQCLKWSPKPDYLVIIDSQRMSLFKIDQGPLRELQLKFDLGESIPTLRGLITKLSTKIELIPEKPARKSIFIDRYNLLLRRLIQAYHTIIQMQFPFGKINSATEKINSSLSSSAPSSSSLFLDPEVINSLGLDISNESPQNSSALLRALASQASYLLLNKIFAYNLIRVQFAHRFQYQLPPLLPSINQSINQSPTSIQSSLKQAFDAVMTTFEFAPIFQADPFFAELPFSPEINSAVIEFQAELEEFNFTFLDDDFIGEIYQVLLPLEKKKELGQIYTPAEVARTMSQLAIRDPKAIILDPSCGCGSFIRKLIFA